MIQLQLGRDNPFKKPPPTPSTLGIGGNMETFQLFLFRAAFPHGTNIP